MSRDHALLFVTASHFRHRPIWAAASGPRRRAADESRKMASNAASSELGRPNARGVLRERVATLLSTLRAAWLAVVVACNSRTKRGIGWWGDTQPRGVPMSFARAILCTSMLVVGCGDRANTGHCASPVGLGGSGSTAVPGSTELGPDAGLPQGCAPGGPGRTDCAPNSESCCASPLVTGGTYYRLYTNGGCGPTGENFPATVSSFRLDKYDVTVGRFRQFVNAVLPADGGAGWFPEAGSGKHTHLNGGRGLVNTAVPGTYEPGWVPSDNNNMSPTSSNLTSCLVSCRAGDGCMVAGPCPPGDTCAPQSGYSPCTTWTDAPSTRENLPIVCVNWYEAY